VPRDTDLSTPNASIDAFSVRARWQCVKSWLQTVTECRHGGLAPEALVGAEEVRESALAARSAPAWFRGRHGVW
jgi:hypothetical protein